LEVPKNPTFWLLAFLGFGWQPVQSCHRERSTWRVISQDQIPPGLQKTLKTDVYFFERQQLTPCRGVPQALVQFAGSKMQARSEADGGQGGGAQLPLEILALVLRVLQAHSQAGPPDLAAEVAQLQHHALRSEIDRNNTVLLDLPLVQVFASLRGSWNPMLKRDHAVEPVGELRMGDVLNLCAIEAC
jgi:hypothetical protein